MFNVVSHEKVSPTVNRIIKKLIKKMVLPLLTILLITTGFPVWAGKRLDCKITGGVLSMSDIDLQVEKMLGGSKYQGPSHKVEYECAVHPLNSITEWYPSLSSVMSDFGSVISLLTELGLGIDIVIQENGSGPVTIQWNDVKKNNFTIPFGARMSTNHCIDDGGQVSQDGYNDCVYKRSAYIGLTLFVENDFNSINISTDVAGKTDALYIVPAPLGTKVGYPGIPGQGINTSPFNVRILSKNLFKLEVTPQTVNLGRLYKTDTNLFRSGAFDVKVIQQKNTTPKQSFTLPLDITFQSGQFSLTPDGKGLVLKNTDGESGNSDGNGLQLAIRDKTLNELVTFDKKRSLGDLNIEWNHTGTNSVTRQYAVEVSRINGAEIKTGQFTASVPVVVTYN
ncbi:hypothetical protein CE655_11635 [Salmonella enterica]|nr:hypothetical protein [Salmonella enterica]